MPEYRIYLVGADDQEATEKAKQAIDGHDIDLWQCARFIVRIAHEGGRAP